MKDLKVMIEETLKIDPFIRFKRCKVCNNNLPVCDVFYFKEKRIIDGYENKCRVCRGSQYKEVLSLHVVEQESNNILTNKDDVIKYYERFLSSGAVYTQSKNFIKDNYKTILKYLIEDKYNMTDEEILKIERKWIQQHKLYGLSINTFNGSTFDMINSVYPDRFKAWDFVSVGNIYWKKENNRRDALIWFIDKLFKNKIIITLNDLPNVLGVETFKQYRLMGLLIAYFKGHPFYAIDYIYPNMFYEWEYNVVPNGYWDVEENRIRALKQYIEDRLKIKIKYIPYILSHEYFYIHGNKFRHVMDKYYSCNFNEYINICYPGMIDNSKLPYKNRYLTLDGIIVKSEPERLIHYLFKKNKLDFVYCDSNKYKFYDEVNHNNYIPDWMIECDDCKIIIEYYGLLNCNGSFSDDIGYNNKYELKDKYYKDLCNVDSNYKYISIYSDDLKHNYKGLINKFKEVNIYLNV